MQDLPGRPGQRPRRCLSAHPARRVRRHHGHQRQRQIDAVEPAGGARPSKQRRSVLRGTVVVGDPRPGSLSLSEDRLCLSIVFPTAHADGGRKRANPHVRGITGAPPARGESTRIARLGRHEPSGQPPADAIVGRRASAHRHCAGTGERSGPALGRRADGQPRLADGGASARSLRAPAPRQRHDDRDGDARSGSGGARRAHPPYARRADLCG